MALEFGDDPAPVEHKRAMRDVFHLLEIGGEHEDGQTALKCARDELVDIRAGTDIDTDSRLLEDKDPGGKFKPTAKDDFLLVAATECLNGSFGIGGADAEKLRPFPSLSPLSRRQNRSVKGNPRCLGLRKKFSRTESGKARLSSCRFAEA
jgi:hypothetical protein